VVFHPLPKAWFECVFGKRSALLSGVEGDRTTLGLDSNAKPKKRGTPNKNFPFTATPTVLQMVMKVIPVKVLAEMDQGTRLRAKVPFRKISCAAEETKFAERASHHWNPKPPPRERGMACLFSLIL
jgi:hypothetical protein